jgi:ABC-type Fe3+-hydroxamate transport system substrate-binding protein
MAKLLNFQFLCVLRCLIEAGKEERPPVKTTETAPAPPPPAKDMLPPTEDIPTPDAGITIGTLSDLINKPGKRNFVRILKESLEQLVQLDPQVILASSNKKTLQEILTFLCSPPRELKREFKQLETSLLESARQKLISALRS